MPASALLGLGLGVALGVAKSASSGEVTQGPQEIPRSRVVNTKIGRLGGMDCPAIASDIENQTRKRSEKCERIARKCLEFDAKPRLRETQTTLAN